MKGDDTPDQRRVWANKLMQFEANASTKRPRKHNIANEQLAELAAAVQGGHATTTETASEVKDLHRLVRDVGDIVQQRATGKGLSFELEVSPEVPLGIVTDVPKLRQILVNLLGNAVKFTADGGVTLHVAESPKDSLRFDVPTVATDRSAGSQDCVHSLQKPSMTPAMTMSRSRS